MLDAIFRIDHLSEPNAVALIHQHNLAACDDRVVDADIKRLSRDTIKFDELP